MEQMFKEKCDKCRHPTCFYRGCQDGKNYCDKYVGKLDSLRDENEKENENENEIKCEF